MNICDVHDVVLEDWDVHVQYIDLSNKHVLVLLLCSLYMCVQNSNVCVVLYMLTKYMLLCKC